ncbi:hypothetical protein KJ975_12345 [Myxococcota bacterium]|nr:hypothetical protein [Myxococcota bacterium]
MHPHELDQLVQAITDLVMARLKSTALPPDRSQTLTVLWPVASAARDQILAAVSAFRQEGRKVQWLVHADLINELLPMLPAEEQPRCHSLDQAPVQAILANLRSSDVLLLAAVHFEAARQLLALDDGHVWIHVLLQAHLTGQTILIGEDLLSSRGLAAQNHVAQEAHRFKRQLQQTGYQLVAAQDLANQLKNMTQAYNHGLQNTRELLTEQDVENLFRAGHRELRLQAGTLVTPLAESKATELGLRLLRMQE